MARLLPIVPRIASRLAVVTLIGTLLGLLAASSAAAAPACTDNWTNGDGTGIWSDNGNWSTHHAPASSAIACLGSGAAVTLDENAGVAGLQLDGAVVTASGSESLTVAGELDLGAGLSPDVFGGALALDTAPGATTVVASAATVCDATGSTWINGGAITLGVGADLGGADGSTCPAGTAGGILENAADGSITATGAASIATGAFDDAGQVTADVATLAVSAPDASGAADTGTWRIDGGATVRMRGNRTIPGTFAGSGQLEISAGVIDLTGASGTAGLGGVTVDGGTLQTESPQTNPLALTDLTAQTGSTITGSGSLNVSGALDVTNGAGGELGIGDGLDLVVEPNATATIAGSAVVCEAPTAAIDSEGTLVLGQGADLGASDRSSCLSGDGGGLVTNEGTITTAHSASIAPAFFDNEGTVDVGSGELAVPASSSAGDHDTGLWSVDSGATLAFSGTDREIDGGAQFLGGGTLTFAGAGDTDFLGTTDLSGLGHLVIDAGATATVQQSLTAPPVTAVSGAIAGPGEFVVPSTAALGFLSGQPRLVGGLELEDAGTASLTGSIAVCVGADATLVNTGTVALGSGSELGDAIAPGCGGTLLNASGGSISATGGATLDPGAFENDGTVSASTGTLVLAAPSVAGTPDTGTYVISPTAHLKLSGHSRELAGTLAGAGTLTLSGGATLILDASAAGTIGSLSLLTGTTLEFAPDATTPTSGAAPIAVTSTATLGGTLALDDSGLSPSTAETLKLLDLAAPPAGSPLTPADASGWSIAAGPGGLTANVSPASTAVTGSPGSGGNGSGSPTGSTAPGAPVNATPPAISGDAGLVGETLTDVSGQWSGTPTAIARQWEDCDPTGTTCSPIAGATGSTYTTTEGDVDDTIEIFETATNASGASAPAASEPTTLVLDAGDVGDDGSDAGDGSGDDGGFDPGDDGIGDGGSSTVSAGSTAAGSRQATVSLISRTVTGTAVGVALGCPGRTTCLVSLRLLATVSSPAASHAHGLGRIVTIGEQRVRLRARTLRVIALGLDATGRRLLSSSHTLHAELTATQSSHELHAVAVTFTLAPARAAGAGGRGARTHRPARRPRPPGHTLGRRPRRPVTRTRRPGHRSGRRPRCPVTRPRHTARTHHASGSHGARRSAPPRRHPRPRPRPR